MNLSSPIVIGLLAAGLIVQTDGASAQEAKTVPSEIVLNGVMTTSDTKRAFFRAAFTPGAPKADFMLAEGETRYGIQLIEVDARLNAVKICNHGLMQTIPICQAPEIVWSGTPFTPAGRPRLPAIAPQNNPPGQTGDYPEDANANTLAPFAGMAAGIPGRINSGSNNNGSNNGGSNSGSNNSGSNNDGLNNDGTSSTADAGNENSSGSTSAPQDHVYQWWIQEAQKIEQARVETAQRVLAGEWQPYPLTPLTPPDTSPQLIGTYGVFMEHGPGVIVSGS